MCAVVGLRSVFAFLDGVSRHPHVSGQISRAIGLTRNRCATERHAYGGCALFRAWMQCGTDSAAAQMNIFPSLKKKKAVFTERHFSRTFVDYTDKG